MVDCFVDPPDNGKDLIGVQQNCESHGRRSLKVPSRLEVRFVRASGQSAHCLVSIRDLHTAAMIALII